MIHNTAIIHASAKIGENVAIGAYCTIGEGVVLHDNVKLKPHVVIDCHTEIGENTEVYSFAALGGAPQSTSYKGEDTKLIVGKNNIIREGVTFNRGTIGDKGVTIVGDNGFFMANSHVAHDCVVGNNVIFANNAALGGHSKVGNFVFMGGYTTVHQFTRIGDYAMSALSSYIKEDIIPYATVGGAGSDGAKILGLNTVGLKRRGFTKQEIGEIHDCFKAIFFGEKLFSERLEEASETYKNSEKASKIIEFLQSKDKRQIMKARNKGEE
jgi:UDP-N-acetylglucosamine acyltransferase